MFSLDAPRMSLLKGIFIFLCIMALFGAITGIASIHTTGAGTVVTRHDISGRVVALLLAAFFGAAWFGLHKRSIVAWRIGWIVLVLFFADFLYSSLSWSLTLTSIERWLLSGGFIVMGLGFTLWAVLWWKRRRSYFYP